MQNIKRTERHQPIEHVFVNSESNTHLQQHNDCHIKGKKKHECHKNHFIVLASIQMKRINKTHTHKWNLKSKTSLARGIDCKQILLHLSNIRSENNKTNGARKKHQKK